MNVVQRFHKPIERTNHMGRKILLGIIVLALAMTGVIWNYAIPTEAQSLLDSYNPPLGTPDDNECNEGGTMNPHCINENLWICGWIMARYNRDVIPLEQVPVECLPEPVPSAPDFEPGPICVPEWQECGCEGSTQICIDSCDVVTETANASVCTPL
jgi:hypothetical protein